MITDDNPTLSALKISNQTNILLIEDNPADQLLFQETLQSTAIHIEDLLTAETIEQGMEVLQHNAVDVVLLDLSLPDNFGLDGLQKIKDTYPRVPVIMLTGLDDNIVALDAIKNGAEDYLIKGKYTDVQLEKSIRYSYERNQSRQLLNQNERYFRSLIENSTDLTFLLRKGGTIHHINNICEEVLGLKPEEMCGKSILDFACPDDTDNISKLIEDWNDKTTIKGPVEFCLINNNGSVRYLSATCKDMRSDPVINGIIMNAHDITARKRAEKKLVQNHVKALQYQSLLLSSQLNPHFIFNSLNSIQFFILDNNHKPALTFLSNFSTLMRSVLRNSTKRHIRLDEEIEFLKLYLNLELQRSSGKFTYEINIEDDIDVLSTMIPPMLLQPYVENTIIHGVGNLVSGGHIEINFSLTDNQLLCKITDNGVGRTEAGRLKILRKGNQHESQSSGITSRRLEVLNMLEDGGYESSIIDNKDDKGESSGTTVIIKTPLIQEE
ncbi:MAG: PAS domain S-box protein [Flavobacteriales bacterium]|nr:PAS domain S-box protein [Flavobacteriales bacterium]